MKVSYTLVSLSHNRKLNALVPFRLFIVFSLVVFLLLSLIVNTYAQGKLVIPKKGEFKLEKDTLVVDELIIGDSAKIVLTKATSMIIARHMVVGTRVRIMGIGEKGVNGRIGRTAAQPDGVCKPGRNGEDGKSGTAGGAGKILILDVDLLTIDAMLIINLAGGNGGDGGKGGDGSQGSNSMAQCLSNGGNGGSGGNGGAGGPGGNLTIINSMTAVELTSKINLYNRGGYKGIGGDGGEPGQRGSGAAKESKLGLIGKGGTDGTPGVDGRSLFYSTLPAAGNGSQ